MPIISIILNDVTGTFSLDSREVNLEWTVYSNSIYEFPVSIVNQGTVLQMIVGNRAMGWLPPGSRYVLGFETIRKCYAGPITVSERKIIKGTGNYEIQFTDGTVSVVPIPPQGIVRWKVKQTYSTKEQEKSPQEPSVNDKITVKMSIELEDIPFVRDVRSGQLVLNSAGQFFNPPPIMKRKIINYSLSRREAGNPLWKSKIYNNVVNSDSLYGAMPGTLLMESITCDYDGESWSSVTYNIKERLEGWQTALLDTGYEARDIDGRLFKILADDGTPVSEPVKLDGAGHVLPFQELDGFDVGPFWKYPEMSFSALNIPNFYELVSQQELNQEEA